jgi:murein DD-endopeptidase MepM/ murein hydrolase activator NlpD
MQDVAEKKQEELLELEAMIGETEDTLDRSQAELSDWEQKQEDMEQESEDISREIAQLQRMMNAGSGPSGTAPPQGSMTWPYPGDYKVYSGFGMRWHPIYKTWKMHYGVDLGGSYGNPIVAAADGEVILVREWWPDQNTGGSGYGNYLVIDHGGYISTLYAHCKSINVSVGDKVVAGQKIAVCGSTGGSTGPHLHFEVIEGSTKVDPELYIT